MKIEHGIAILNLGVKFKPYHNLLQKYNVTLTLQHEISIIWCATCITLEMKKNKSSKIQNCGWRPCWITISWHLITRIICKICFTMTKAPFYMSCTCHLNGYINTDLWYGGWWPYWIWRSKWGLIITITIGMNFDPKIKHIQLITYIFLQNRQNVGLDLTSISTI